MDVIKSESFDCRLRALKMFKGRLAFKRASGACAWAIRATFSRSATGSARCASITAPVIGCHMQRGTLLVVRLCGGDKSRQGKDIARAKRIAAGWTE